MRHIALSTVGVAVLLVPTGCGGPSEQDVTACQTLQQSRERIVPASEFVLSQPLKDRGAAMTSVDAVARDSLRLTQQARGQAKSEDLIKQTDYAISLFARDDSDPEGYAGYTSAVINALYICKDDLGVNVTPAEVQLGHHPKA